MESKSWKESYTELERLVLPPDTNIFNALYGGRLVEWIDNVAGIVATRHSRRRNVTGSIDSLFFLVPIHLGDIVTITGRLNYVTRSTMEIEVNVTTEEGLTGTTRVATKSFLTYVAVDQDGKPTDIPGLKIETEEEKRIFEEAALRSKNRLAQLTKIKSDLKKS